MDYSLNSSRQGFEIDHTKIYETTCKKIKFKRKHI